MKTIKINSISKRPYKGPVYNLHLESVSDKDDLFWIEQNTGIVTHNCFPKDINAIIHYCDSVLGYDLGIMKKAWQINLGIRKDIDWAKIAGAVSEDYE